MRVVPVPTLTHICKIGGSSKQCKFLGKQGKNFVCMKHTELEGTIVNLAQQNKDNQDTAEHPQGDNCDGYGNTLLSEVLENSA